MTIVQRLKILIVLFVVILLIIGITEFIQLNRTLEVVRQFAEVEEPLEISLLEVEINANEGYRDIIGYIRNEDPIHLAEYDEQDELLAHYVRQFRVLTSQNDEHHNVAVLESIQNQLHELGVEIVDLSNDRTRVLGKLKSDIASLKELTREVLGSRTQKETLPRLAEVLHEYILMLDAFVEIQQHPIPVSTSMKKHMQKSGNHVLTTLVSERNRSHAIPTEVALSQIESYLRVYTPQIEKLLKLSAEINHNLGQYEELLIRLDKVLDDDLQPFIRQASKEALSKAYVSARSSIIFLLLSVFMGILVSAWIAFRLGTRMVDAIHQLTTGASEIGKGNLNTRIKIYGDDEFGLLAHSFNQMATNLRENKDKFRAIYENLQDIYLEKSLDGVILEISPAVDSILGYRADKLVGREITVLYKDKETHDALLRKLNESGSFTDMEVELQTSDGRWLYGSISAQICYDNEKSSRKICSMIRDITARKIAEQKLNSLLRENRKLTKQVFSSIEMERRRLARDLHDEMGQSIAAIILSAQVIQRQSSECSPEIPAQASNIRQVANDLISSMRRFINHLRPSILDSFGLVDTYRHTIENWCSQHPDIQCTFDYDGFSNLPDDVEIYLYRVLQESLTNISKHSKADRIQVSLHLCWENNLKSICLSIKDNGVGMPLRAAERGTGITGMRERVVSIGGDFAVISNHSLWHTIINVRIPLQNMHHREDIV